MIMHSFYIECVPPKIGQSLDHHMKNFCNLFCFFFQFLPFPELIPFRMSPQITNVVLPHAASGKLKCCMVHTLRALRNSPRLLLNTMDVFVKEPSLDWKVG